MLTFLLLNLEHFVVFQNNIFWAKILYFLMIHMMWKKTSILKWHGRVKISDYKLLATNLGNFIRRMTEFLNMIIKNNNVLTHESEGMSHTSGRSSRKVLLLTTTLVIFSLFLLKKVERRKGEWIANIVIKSHAFLLDHPDARLNTNYTS